MVNFDDSPPLPGADIKVWQKILIYGPFPILITALLIFYRRRPFLSFYILSILQICIILHICNLPHKLDWLLLLKQAILAMPFCAQSLWRISSISEVKFEKYFSGFKPNVWFHRRLRGKINDCFVEYFYTFLLSTNILWAAYYDIVYFESYWNGCCGLILAFAVPLPSSIGYNSPGLSISSESDDPKVDMAIPDMHWLWICTYSSWNFLFAFMYGGTVWVTPIHLLPCFLYALVSGRNDIYLMIRYCIHQLCVFSACTRLVSDVHVVFYWLDVSTCTLWR